MMIMSRCTQLFLSGLKSEIPLLDLEEASHQKFYRYKEMNFANIQVTLEGDPEPQMRLQTWLSP